MFFGLFIYIEEVVSCNYSWQKNSVCVEFLTSPNRKEEIKCVGH